MARRTCPKCAAPLGDQDTVCIECGAPVPTQSSFDDTRVQVGVVVGPSRPTGAAAGMASPGDEKRSSQMLIIDKQNAELLRKERPTYVVLGIISLLVFAVFSVIAAKYFKEINGFAGFKGFDFASIRAQRIGMFSDLRILFIITTGLSLSGLLCLVGEIIRFAFATSAIKAVLAGERPDVVGITIFTVMGLSLAAVVCPPLGIVMGLIMRIAGIGDVKEVGARMLNLGLLVIGLVTVTILWDVTAEFAASKTPTVKTPN